MTRHISSRFIPYLDNCSLKIIDEIENIVEILMYGKHSGIVEMFMYLIVGSKSAGNDPSLLDLLSKNPPLYSSIGLLPHQTTTDH